MVYFFTDFGYQGPYVGLLKAAFKRLGAHGAMIDLMHDVPPFDVFAGSILLRQLQDEFSAGDIVVAVVDPGVGSAQREPVIVTANGVRFVGPDNGLFGELAGMTERRVISWRPDRLSASFHGRDLFAPVAARLVKREHPDDFSQLTDVACHTIAHDGVRVVYVDNFGNCMLSLRGYDVPERRPVSVNGVQLPWSPTFAEVDDRQLFWYTNSIGLLELAAAKDSAASRLNLSAGSVVSFDTQPV